MKRWQFYPGLFIALMFLSAAAASSDAGWFRRGYAEPPAWQAAAPVANATVAPAPTPVAPTSAPTVTPAAQPQVVPVSTAVAAPTTNSVVNPVVAPPAGYYYAAPCPAGAASGWSNLPRSSWDYGRFPPY